MSRNVQPPSYLLSLSILRLNYVNHIMQKFKLLERRDFLFILGLGHSPSLACLIPFIFSPFFVASLWNILFWGGTGNGTKNFAFFNTMLTCMNHLIKILKLVEMRQLNIFILGCNIPPFQNPQMQSSIFLFFLCFMHPVSEIHWSDVRST